MREHEPWWEHVAYRAFLPFAAPWVDLFIANSKHTLARLQELVPVARRPGIVVYNSILERIGAPTLRERTEARAALSLPDNAFVFGFAGRIVERKGWRDFVECAKRFREETNVFWILAGDGSEERMLRAICAEESLINVRPLGFQKDMRSFYSSLDVCIIPSHWEPHGLVQLEAQSYGLPVIAADVPGMNETLIAGENALLFSPRDHRALFQRVKSVLREPALLASLSRGSISNAQNFTLKKYHDSLESCYECLDRPIVGARGSHPR